MSGLPQGPMKRGSKVIVYFCREDPRVFVYKHPRWKWVGVTLNFAHPVSLLIMLRSFLSFLLCFVPGMLLRSHCWTLGGLALWAGLLCWYFFKNAERDLQRYATDDASGGEQSRTPPN